MLSVVTLGLLLASGPPIAEAQQPRQITGTVTIAGTELPLADAVISVVGGTAMARTGANGQYRLDAPASDVTLLVRAIGYKRATSLVAMAQSTANFILERDVLQLEQVVVTGQATTVERRSATTAVAVVSGEDISKVAAPTIENALIGKVSGVNLQTNSGAPGGGIQMQIRGNNTILGAFDPLYVVDGVIYSNQTIAGGRGVISAAAFATAEDDAVNRVADINPADIENIEILKGAAASSIYGSKAANGVVIITTKRGQVGSRRVNVTQRLGQFSATKTLDSRRWTQAEAIAAFGDGVGLWFDKDPTPYFNHYDEVFDNRSLQFETNADIAGGTENTRYFLGATWKKDPGIERNTQFVRQALRVNVDQILSPKVTVNVSTVFNRAEHDRGWNNNCNNFECHGYAFAYTPSFVDFKRRDPDTGDFVTPNWGIQANSIQLSQLGVNDENTDRFTGGATLTYKAFTDNRQSLRVIFGGGIDAFQQNDDLWAPNELFAERPQAQPGVSIENDGRSQFYNWNASFVHMFTPGATWSLSTSGGMQYEDRQLKTSRITTSNLIPGQRSVGQGTNTTGVENLTQERTVALYGQEELRLFNERLLLQGGVRAERSSVNGDIDKLYVFPKLSGSYRLLDLLGNGSEIKPRVAYGETGNLPLFGQKFTTLNTPQLGGLLGFAVAGGSGFKDVSPERVKEVEFGLDGIVLGGRMTWELTTFNRTTTNLLLQRVPAPSSGFATQVFNGGKIQNTGFEVSVGGTPVDNRNLRWISRATFTDYTSEVKDLGGLPPFRPNLSGFGGLGVTFIQVGRPLTQLVGRAYDSLGVRTATDVPIGNTAPDYRMGFVNNVTFHGLNIGVVLDYQHGGDIINLTQFLYDDANTAEDFGSPAFDARKKAQADGVMGPYIEKATFLKVREVTVGTELPRSWMARAPLGFKSARVALSGRNLFTFQKYSGLDPEVANLGSAAIRNNLDVAPYPPSRNIVFEFSLGY